MCILRDGFSVNCRCGVFYHSISVELYGAVPNVSVTDLALTDGDMETCVHLGEHEDTWGYTFHYASSSGVNVSLAFHHKCDIKVEVYIMDREVMCITSFDLFA